MIQLFMGVGCSRPNLKNDCCTVKNATPAETTLLFTSYMLVTGVVMLFTGFLSSRIGLKKTLMTGLFIIVVFAGLRGYWEYRYVDWVTCWLGSGNALFVSTALATIVSILVGNTEKAIMMYEAALLAARNRCWPAKSVGSWAAVSMALSIFSGVAFLMFCGFYSPSGTFT